MSEEGPRCRFCGCLIGEGYKDEQDRHVCIDCWSLVCSIIEDSLPHALYQLGRKAEAQLKGKLEAYYYEAEMSEAPKVVSDTVTKTLSERRKQID